MYVQTLGKTKFNFIMKKMFLFLIIVTCSSFNKNYSEKKAYCYVYVKDKYGSPDEYAKVSGLTCGTFGGFTSDYETDKNGFVKLEWTSQSDDVCNIYVEGKSNEGKYKHGETYNFTTK